MKSPDFDALKRDPNASALLSDSAALKHLLGSPDAKRLMELLTAQNGGALQQAAKRAGSGDTTALSQMLGQLTQSPEGAQLMERLQRQVKKGPMG